MIFITILLVVSTWAYVYIFIFGIYGYGMQKRATETTIENSGIDSKDDYNLSKIEEVSLENIDNIKGFLIIGGEDDDENIKNLRSKISEQFNVYNELDLLYANNGEFSGSLLENVSSDRVSLKTVKTNEYEIYDILKNVEELQSLKNSNISSDTNKQI